MKVTLALSLAKASAWPQKLREHWRRKVWSLLGFSPWNVSGSQNLAQWVEGPLGTTRVWVSEAIAAARLPMFSVSSGTIAGTWLELAVTLGVGMVRCITTMMKVSREVKYTVTCGLGLHIWSSKF